MAQTSPASSHRWRFFRAGGFDQVVLESGADLAALGELDQKLWVALACPTVGLEFDARTLQLVDADKDGRIRALDVIGAARFATRNLVRPDDLMLSKGELPLASIRVDTPEGKTLQEASKAVLESLGKPNAPALTVEDATAAAKAFDASPFNGDGVVPPTSAPDAATRQLVEELLATVGGEPDRGGKLGATAAKVEAFFKELEAYVAWLGTAKPENQPLGEQTAAAADAVEAVRVKVDDYFARCRLAAFDARALAALNREEKEYLALAAKDLSITAQEVASFPLARIEAGRPLPLQETVNPAWADAVAKLRSAALLPLGETGATLGEAQWKAVLAKLAPHFAWRAAKQGAAVEKLGPARAKALLQSDARAQLTALVEKDLVRKPLADAIESVERLVRLHRDLRTLCTNFVSFREFYLRKDKAIFQAGRLFIDQRSCDLCIRVEDVAKHSALATLARTYLAYCECVRRGTNEKMVIAAAVTDGDSDNLSVGRNGVFYDRSGRDWDATIVKIVDSPISVRQAFWAPYKRLVRFVDEQVSKRAAAADAAANERLLAAAGDVAKAGDTGKAPPPPAKVDVGAVAALGVAVGGITAALGVMLQAFFGLGLWMPLGLLGLLFGISGPAMFVAWLKLRQRNLGPLLDACGWAVNASARMNVPFGGSLTQVAVLPKGAKRDLADPFAEKPLPWKAWAAAVLLLVIGASWYLGKLDRHLPQRAQRAKVLGPLDAVAAPAPP